MLLSATKIIDVLYKWLRNRFDLIILRLIRTVMKGMVDASPIDKEK